LRSSRITWRWKSFSKRRMLFTSAPRQPDRLDRRRRRSRCSERARAARASCRLSASPRLAAAGGAALAEQAQPRYWQTLSIFVDEDELEAHLVLPQHFRCSRNSLCSPAAVAEIDRTEGFRRPLIGGVELEAQAVGDGGAFPGLTCAG
jgi:hypothetical protein